MLELSINSCTMTCIILEDICIPLKIEIYYFKRLNVDRGYFIFYNVNTNKSQGYLQLRRMKSILSNRTYVCMSVCGTEWLNQFGNFFC